jgi:methyl-accepting chemotaxis protein
MGDESGSLNLAVQFIAVVEGFSASLDKVTAKLESLVTRIDKMSGKSSKASDAMAKDQDKVAASVEKTSKKMTEAATAANNYGRTIETSRVALKGLDAATIANLNSSNMSKEMFSTLSSKMKVFSVVFKVDYYK